MAIAVDQQLHSAGWSSLVARRAHNPEVVGSNPAPATKSRSRSDNLKRLSDLLLFCQVTHTLNNRKIM